MNGRGFQCRAEGVLGGLASHLLHERDGALATSATGTGWERTPWPAVQGAARDRVLVLALVLTACATRADPAQFVPPRCEVQRLLRPCPPNDQGQVELLGERCDYKATDLVIDFGILKDGNR